MNPSRDISPQTEKALKNRTRFITAASLFDGHDAAINVMRRILQSSGAEVIHLGHNRSVSDIVTAALHEDAQAIAISSYQGGHVEFFKYAVDRLKELGMGHVKIFGGGGGTITPKEMEELHAYGVTRLYSPEDGRKLGLQGMIDDMLKRSAVDPAEQIDWKGLSAFEKNPRALAQALTCIELGEDTFSSATQKSHLADFRKLRDQISHAKSNARVIGITGTGGAGKSSLTDELLLRLLEKDKNARIAVLAIDPTRRKTGGALLGDRMRMNSLSNERCFMRSFATRQANSAVSNATREAVDLLKAAGFDWVIVETGGIGQADTSIVELADINVYVMTCEFGAPTQLEKINMLDYAHIVVINKFDKKGALDALTDVRKQYRRNHLEFEKLAPSRYPVFGTIASRFNNEGVNRMFEHLISLRDEKNRFMPLARDFEPGDPLAFAIVPTDRTQYLSDISHTVRSYKKEVEDVALKFANLDALESAAKQVQSTNAKEELESIRTNVTKTISQEWQEALSDFEKLSVEYQKEALTYKVRDKVVKVPQVHQSLSHQNIRRVVPPQLVSRSEKMRFVGLENLPGYFPYTAGVFPFKRLDEDPKRQFAGEGTPTQTNKRFHFLCEGENAKRLSTAFDSVTLYGQDPHERPDIYGKIGESGVSVCTLEDAKKLYAGFDLCDPNTSVSMTINGPAPMLLAFFFNTAIDQQVDKFTKEHKRQPSTEELVKIRSSTLQKVRGTVQADILKEDQAQNTCIFSIEFALRMMGDMQQYFITNEIRNYYSVSISGYHIAEAGANPISQLAFTLANGFTFVEYYRSRGMKIDDFAPNFSFFFSNGLDAEYTVIGRVARRIWAIAMKRYYGANDRSQKLKYHIQTSGRSLHAQEVTFNDIRTTLQALLAYFDNCNSLHTNAYDEAVTTPTAESVRRAMAIQLVIAREFGWAKNENPLQGSYFIQELTDLVEQAVLKEFDSLTARGGVLGAMETQYQRSKIQEESMYYEGLKHSGQLPLIGVNTFINPIDNSASHFAEGKLTRAGQEEKQEQIRNLRDFQKRHADKAPQALARLKAAAAAGENIFEALMQAARVCSLGQMSQALYEAGGQYRRGI